MRGRSGRGRFGGTRVSVCGVGVGGLVGTSGSSLVI